MSKLNIAFLSVFYPFRGGIAQFNNELLLSLRAHAKIQAYNFSRQYPKLLFPGKTQLVDNQDLDPDVNAIPVLDSINPFSFSRTSKIINKRCKVKVKVCCL